MIITTTHIVERRNVAEYMCVLSVALVMVISGGNKGVQREWQVGVEGANKILIRKATEIGADADAVAAVRYDAVGMQLLATDTADKLRA